MLLIVFRNSDTGEHGTLGINGGALTISNTLTLQANSVLRYTLTEAPVGFSPGIFVTNGSETATMTIGGALLELFVGDGFTPVLNETYLISTYDILDGTFFGLAEGAMVSAINSPYEFTISYVDGIDGNSIGLTTVAIPEPHHAAIVMLLAAAGALLRRGRSRK